MATTTSPVSPKLDVERIREDFPILHQEVYGKPLVYLDNAASSQKPKQVIDTISNYYQTTHANIHRGVHYLSEKATAQYEAARETARQFINAGSVQEINFVRGTTEAVNLVAQAYGRKFLKPGDAILITAMEHHSNIVPWQMLCEQTGAELRVLPVCEDGTWDMDELPQLLDEKVQLVSAVHVSNTLGTINPVKELIQQAHSANAVVILDGAQAAPHMNIDVQDLDVDFYAFSGHKVFGPTGIGVLYGKTDLLDKMDPYMGGGEMIRNVSFAKTTYNDLPYKFEAGTPNIAGGIGLGAALEYVQQLGLDNIAAYEQDLLCYANEKLESIEGIRFIGTAPDKASVISFLIGDHHPYDVGVLLDKQGIAIRTGHHCTEPLMGRFSIPGTCRASFAFYNTKEEVDRLVKGLEKAVGMLG